MYLGVKSEVGVDCRYARDTLIDCTGDSGITNTGVELLCVVRLYDALELVPRSEQFRLQQRRASEVSRPLVAD